MPRKKLALPEMATGRQERERERDREKQRERQRERKMSWPSTAMEAAGSYLKAH
jgi:hypothetical protein